MRIRAKDKHKQAGFTLVEVLVSLFIFSILSTSTLTILTLTLQNKAQLKTKSELLSKRAITHTLLKNDFANTLAVARTDEYGQPYQAQFFGGNSGGTRILSLARTGWENPAGIERRSNLQSVEYSLDNGVLTRHIRPRFNAVSSVEALDQTLLANIRSAQFTFFDGKNWVENWLTGAPPQGVGSLPKLAAIEFIFENEDKLRQIFFVGADQ